jgi:DnaJ-class molecular chaperone
MEWKTFDFRAGRTKTDRKISQILKGGRFRCSFCAGVGILHGNKSIKCPVCKGSGTVCLPGPVIVCVYCEGRGEYTSRPSIACTVCGGKGLVSVTELIEVCKHFRGTGPEPGNKLPCLKCKGNGVKNSN